MIKGYVANKDTLREYSVTWESIDGTLRSKKLDIKSRFNLLPTPLKYFSYTFAYLCVYFIYLLQKITYRKTLLTTTVSMSSLYSFSYL